MFHVKHLYVERLGGIELSGRFLFSEAGQLLEQRPGDLLVLPVVESRNATTLRPNARPGFPKGTSQRYARPSAAAAVESVAIRQSGSSPSTSRNSAWSSSPSTAANVHAPLPYPNEAIALFSAARLRSLRALPLATHTSAKRAPSRCSSNSSHASSRATSYMLPFADFFTRSLAVEIGSPYNRNDSKKRPPRHGRCGGITIGERVCARTESTQGNSSR